MIDRVSSGNLPLFLPPLGVVVSSLVRSSKKVRNFPSIRPLIFFCCFFFLFFHFDSLLSASGLSSHRGAFSPSSSSSGERKHPLRFFRPLLTSNPYCARNPPLGWLVTSSFVSSYKRSLIAPLFFSAPSCLPVQRFFQRLGNSNFPGPLYILLS